MGKFDGVLLISDFDNTLLYTENALRSGGACPAMAERNLAGIRRFMAEGGRFAVATGRAREAYRRYAPLVPTNAPTIVDNGGAIYDFPRETYLRQRFLPDTAREDLEAIAEAFPQVSLELYHDSDLVQALHPSDWNRQHAKLTGLPFQPIGDLRPETVPLPLAKILFVAEKPVLDDVLALIRERGWTERYEYIFSNEHLLEMTAKGANKGEMCLELKALLGCHTMICAGDHLNDLSMLRTADRAFCPANAQPEVLNAPGVQKVCHCTDGAIGHIVEILEGEA